MDDDDALVARAQAELPYATQAFEALAERHYVRIRKVALGIVGNHDDADTVAQDAMLRAFHSLTNLRDPRTFRGWLRQIVVNVARTFLAREKREREKSRSLYRERAVDTYDADTDRPHDPGLGAGFGEMIATLSIEERTILAMKFVEDLEFNEIADVVGLKLSATKMRYYRALDKLKAAREEQQID